LLIMYTPPDWKFLIMPVLAGVIVILIYERFYSFILKKVKP
jgi:hypothetical protein